MLRSALQPGWGPPKEAVAALAALLDDADNHLYGSIMGYEELRQRLKAKVQAQGLSLADQELMITCGAQQAYINAVLCLLDQGDLAFLLCPYYMSHKLGIQLAGGKVHEVPFEEETLKVSIASIRRAVSEVGVPRMLVLCNPGNPSGAVLSEAELWDVIALCKELGTWLVVDSTYADFTYDPALPHIWPCAGGCSKP